MADWKKEEEEQNYSPEQYIEAVNNVARYGNPEDVAAHEAIQKERQYGDMIQQSQEQIAAYDAMAKPFGRTYQNEAYDRHLEEQRQAQEAGNYMQAINNAGYIFDQTEANRQEAQRQIDYDNGVLEANRQMREYQNQIAKANLENSPLRELMNEYARREAQDVIRKKNIEEGGYGVYKTTPSDSYQLIDGNPYYANAVGGEINPNFDLDVAANYTQYPNGSYGPTGSDWLQNPYVDAPEQIPNAWNNIPEYIAPYVNGNPLTPQQLEELGYELPWWTMGNR